MTLNEECIEMLEEQAALELAAANRCIPGLSLRAPEYREEAALITTVANRLRKLAALEITAAEIGETYKREAAEGYRQHLQEQGS